MKDICGETKFLKPSDRNALAKLAQKRSGRHEIIDLSLARKAGTLAAKLGVQLALLIGRDGRVSHVVLGSKEKLYLPDLGRFRLDEARLRRLRLVIFFPDAPKAPLLPFPAHKSSQKGKQSYPVIPSDFLTDLKKLRLDLVLLLDASETQLDGSLTGAYLEHESSGSRFPSSAENRNKSDGISFFHASSLPALNFDFETFIKELESKFKENRPKGFDTDTDKAVLVGVSTQNSKDLSSSMSELAELARSAEIEVVDTFVQKRRSMDPRTLIGKGKIEELVLHCLDLGADLIIFDRELTPGQLRSITKLTELRVVDRSMLILDIFAQRAKSSEGRLQVELAQLKYALPRLTDRDSGLSRLTGGIGGRGPGETKLEVGRRRARERIEAFEKRIEKLASQRGLRRERRQNRGVPVISIVGYTNAGKSTLLNSLTKGRVFTESKLFATLDPSSRRMRFPNDKEVIFVDTVGFIRELPEELITAFRATLEEVAEADLLLHVVDASNGEMREQIKVVEQTLKQLKVGETPSLLVINKCDLLSPVEQRTLVNSLGGIAVSATARDGLSELVAIVQEKLLSFFTGQDPGHFTEQSNW